MYLYLRSSSRFMAFSFVQFPYNTGFFLTSWCHWKHQLTRKGKLLSIFYEDFVFLAFTVLKCLSYFFRRPSSTFRSHVVSGIFMKAAHATVGAPRLARRDVFSCEGDALCCLSFLLRRRRLRCYFVENSSIGVLKRWPTCHEEER